MNIKSILLLIWPYIFFAIVYVAEEVDISGWIFALYFVLAIAINIVNIVYSCTREANSYKKIALNGMVIKIFHIPYYLFTFIIGLVLVLSAVVPALIFFTPVMAIILAIINYVMMITSSSYGINSLIRLKAKGKITNTFFVVNIIMHLIFVLDFISSIIVYAKCKSVDKEIRKEIN